MCVCACVTFVSLSRSFPHSLSFVLSWCHRIDFQLGKLRWNFSHDSFFVCLFLSFPMLTSSDWCVDFLSNIPTISFELFLFILLHNSFWAEHCILSLLERVKIQSPKTLSVLIEAHTDFPQAHAANYFEIGTCLKRHSKGIHLTTFKWIFGLMHGLLPPNIRL